MGIQVLPHLEHVSTTSRPHLVGGRAVTPKQLPIDLPFHAPKEPTHEEDQLGCVRGIAMALGIQTIVGFVGFALWKLHTLIH